MREVVKFTNNGRKKAVILHRIRKAGTMQIAYIPSENVLPRTRVPRPPHAPQRFNRVYTVSLAERGLREKRDAERAVREAEGLYEKEKC